MRHEPRTGTVTASGIQVKPQAEFLNLNQLQLRHWQWMQGAFDRQGLQPAHAHPLELPVLRGQQQRRRKRRHDDSSLVQEQQLRDAYGRLGAEVAEADQGTRQEGVGTLIKSPRHPGLGVRAPQLQRKRRRQLQAGHRRKALQ